MFDFDGQVVIVTGSGSPKGIGRTIAKTFAKQKAAVVIADMNEAGVQDLSLIHIYHPNTWPVEGGFSSHY